MREVLRTASRAGVTAALILSSPYRRALETAKLAADELGYKDDILTTQALLPVAAPHQAWEEIRVHRDSESTPARRARAPVQFSRRVFAWHA